LIKILSSSNNIATPLLQKSSLFTITLQKLERMAARNTFIDMNCSWGLFLRMKNNNVGIQGNN